MANVIRASGQASPSPMVARIGGTRTLGIQIRRTDALVRKVQTGFPFTYLLRLEKRIGLARGQMAGFVAISKRTLARRQQQGQLSADESDRLLRIARLFELTVDLFEGDPDQARTWLLEANPALGDASPLDFASTDLGAREVEHLIGRLEHGVFA